MILSCQHYANYVNNQRLVVVSVNVVIRDCMEWHGKSLGVLALWETTWYPDLFNSEISSVLVIL